MTDRLEPCPTPWCEPEHEKYIWQGPDDLFCVICDGCQVEGPSCENEGGAHDAWNTRTTSPPAQDGLVDALRNALKWLKDPQMGTWTYIEGNYFYRDVDAHAKAIEAALASIEVKS